MRALTALMIALSCTGCGGDEPPCGAAALNSACEGVLDKDVIRQAKRSDNFSRIYDAGDPGDSHAAAARTMLAEDHVAYVCRLAVDDGSASGNDALYLRFTPGLRMLFPEGQDRSYGFFDAYEPGPGMQATNKARSTDVFFPCLREGESDPLTITGTFFNDLGVGTEARFRTLFGSAAEMARLLKCRNTITFPSPDAMKPLPKAH